MRSFLYVYNVLMEHFNLICGNETVNKRRLLNSSNDVKAVLKVISRLYKGICSEREIRLRDEELFRTVILGETPDN